MLIAGDGSGTGWQMGAAWATAVIDRYTGGRKLLRGVWSAGTIMIAELMPYIHALAWYEAAAAGARRRQLGRGVLDVHVLCDNEAVVHQGNHHAGRQKMAPWWACWAGYVRLGYRPVFHWLPGHRDRLGLNVLCDTVSRQTRELLAGHEPRYPRRLGATSLYEVNPDPGDPPCSSSGTPTTSTTGTGSSPTAEG